jgi:hypothetical protein
MIKLRSKLLIIIFLISLATTAQEYRYNYSFFVNSAMSGNYFFSKTCQSGGSTLENVSGKLPVNDSVFHTPGNSLELNYKNAPGGQWQATLFRQEKRGMDHITKAAFLTFWIQVTSSNGLPVIQLMRKDSSLTSAITISPVKAKTWQRVFIPMASMKDFDVNQPENCIAVVFAQQNDQESSENTIFIDDIVFLPTEKSETVSVVPVISLATGYAMHVDLAWAKITDENVHLVKIYRSEDGKQYKATGTRISPA